MNRWKLVVALLLIPVALAAQGIPIKSGSSTDLANVNIYGSLEVVKGREASVSYIAGVSNVAATASTAILSLEAESGRGFRITKVCIQPGSATAQAWVQWQLIRTTTASSGGTVISAEATSGNNFLVKMDPGDSNWSGVARASGTAGTSGAILYSANVPVAITATPPTVWGDGCREFGIVDGKQPIIAAGTSNGVKLMFEGTAGGADLAAQIHFIAQ